MELFPSPNTLMCSTRPAVVWPVGRTASFFFFVDKTKLKNYNHNLWSSLVQRSSVSSARESECRRPGYQYYWYEATPLSIYHTTTIIMHIIM